MAEIERVSLRVFGRDITLACPSDEKDALLSAAELLNEELNGICLLYTSPSPRDEL